jgi:hypothetical protein
VALVAVIAVPPEVGEVEVIDPALKLPVESRLTMALAVSVLVGAVFHFRASAPVVVTGEPLTLKSEPGALRPTLVTDPLPAPGNV